MKCDNGHDVQAMSLVYNLAKRDVKYCILALLYLLTRSRFYFSLVLNLLSHCALVYNFLSYRDFSLSDQRRSDPHKVGSGTGPGPQETELGLYRIRISSILSDPDSLPVRKKVKLNTAITCYCRL